MNRIHQAVLDRNIVRSLAARPRAFTHRARFDAANSSSYHRSSPHVAQHIYRDVDASQRRILMDGSADLADNSPMIRGLIERLVTYVVGCGINPQSASADRGFAAEFDAAFAEWAEDCDIRGGIPWPVLQSQAFRGELRDGDFGTILTSYQGNPYVYAVEGRQIGDRTYNARDFYDGVKLDPIGRPLAYRITDENPGGDRKVTDVEARNFVLFYEPERAGLCRGIPLLSSALNTGRDVQDILTLEKLAVKDASSKTDIIKMESGEIDPTTVMQTGGETLNGSDGEDRATYYREAFGPEAKVIKRDDSWEAYKSDRPGPAWQGFMDFLAQTICLAAKIPPSFLLQIKVGGADTRRDVVAASRVIEQMQERLVAQWKRVVLYVVEFKLGRRLPVDWKAISWQFPKSPSVDAGREAQSDRDDIRAGLMTEQEYQGRWGGNWIKHRNQIELEAVDRVERAKRVAQQTGVTLQEAMALIGFEAKLQPEPPIVPQPAVPEVTP